MSTKTTLAVSPQARTNSGPATAPGKPTILIAEDSADSREMMRLLLEDRGYLVIEADNGASALEVAVKIKPDAVLLDLELPKLDGLSVMRSLRLQPNFKNLPIIVLSGHDPHSYRQRAIDAGCDEYVLKPINFERLQTLLDELVPREGRALVKSA